MNPEAVRVSPDTDSGGAHRLPIQVCPRVLSIKGRHSAVSSSHPGQVATPGHSTQMKAESIGRDRVDPNDNDPAISKASSPMDFSGPGPIKPHFA